MTQTRRGLFAVALGLGAGAATAAAAQYGNDFCPGYRAGWVAAFRNRNMPPAPTPPCPPAPPGGNSFSVGFEAGMMAALAEISSSRY